MGGSLIIPDKINLNFLEDFKKVLLGCRDYRFVGVCGGGMTARNYIYGLDNLRLKKKDLLQSYLGISCTRLNARFMTYFFGSDANKGMPKDMKDVEDYLRRKRIVFCGALRYSSNQTSDSTAVKLANYFNCDFVNLSNVKGLYDKDPKKYKSAKFIPKISHKDLWKMVKGRNFKHGQNFILDSNAVKLMKKYKVRTYILGGDVDNFKRFLKGEHFVGSVVG